MRLIRISPIFFCFIFLACSNHEKKNETDTTNSKPDSSQPINRPPGLNPYASIDISPMDMSYFPIDYPKLKMSGDIKTEPLARVIYSRPHLGGRHLFHELLKYGEPWRLGANESTELDLYKDATIQGKNVKAGRYVIYCIPQADKWDFILNSNTDSWGLQPDSTKDVMHFSIPVIQTNRNIEYFTMVFEKKENGAELVMAWENIEARLSIYW